MSRTFAHDPWWVDFNDPALLVERHDHRDGLCDLPSPSDWFHLMRAGRWTRTTRCRWEVDQHRVPPRCGCPLCTGSFDRRCDRRRDRHRARRQLRAGVWD